MKILPFAFLSSLTLLALPPLQAVAFSTDGTSMNKAGDASKFSDPDEQSPIQMGNSANLQGTASGNSDPNSLRYDYDANTGSFTPHKE